MANTQVEESLVAKELVDIIKDIVRQEISKLDTTIVCQVVSVNADGTYNVYVEPDRDNIIRNIPNGSTSAVKEGDFVYVYKMRGQLNNAFIMNKIGILGDNAFSLLKKLDSRLTRVEDTIENLKGR